MSKPKNNKIESGNTVPGNTVTQLPPRNSRKPVTNHPDFTILPMGMNDFKVVHVMPNNSVAANDAVFDDDTGSDELA